MSGVKQMEHKIKNFYTLEKRLKNISKDEARQMKTVTDSAQEFQNWKIKARCQLQSLLSLQRFEEVPLRPELLESSEGKNYIYEKIVIQTERDVMLPLSFFIPKKNKKDKLPIVLLILGEDSREMETIYAAHYECIKNSNGKKKECLAMKLIKEGYAVAVIDTRGTGERRECTEEPHFSRERLSKIAVTLGYSISGMNVWDGIRVVDYLQMRKEFDGRLFCGGQFDGGMISLYLAAVDDRIQGSFVRDCFYGFQSRLLQQSDESAYDYIPDMWRYFDISDIAAMLAPGPLFIEYSEKYKEADGKSFNTVFQHIWQIREVYQCLDAEDNLQHCVYSGEKRGGFCSDEVIKFLNALSSGMKIPKSLHTWLFERCIKETP